MTSTNSDQCTNCRGRGWKLLTLRRSLTSAGDAGERASLRRSRVTCLPCQGTGIVPPDTAVTASEEEARDDAQN
jgi:DnaJ-class molecular chaperone